MNLPDISKVFLKNWQSTQHSLIFPLSCWRCGCWNKFPNAEPTPPMGMVLIFTSYHFLWRNLTWRSPSCTKMLSALMLLTEIGSRRTRSPSQLKRLALARGKDALFSCNLALQESCVPAKETLPSQVSKAHYKRCSIFCFKFMESTSIC